MSAPYKLASVETSCGQALRRPEEPLEIKGRVRRQVLDRPDRWERITSDGGWLADWLWTEWAPTLQAWRIPPDRLAGIVAGYRQELWLWIMGERTWSHIIDGLAGRVIRRRLCGTGAIVRDSGC